MQESSTDKQWAKAYILDPLTAPEPSQDTGIASSHNLAANIKRMSLSDSKSTSSKNSKDSKGSSDSKKSKQRRQSSREYLTPPASASPSRSSFHPSNPFYATSESSNLASPPRTPSRSPRGAPRSSRRYPPSTSVTRSASARVPHLGPNQSDSRHNRSRSTGNFDLSRQRSINQRFPGDMSHRPLEILRKEARAADRAPHLRRKNMPHTDTIDALDTIGGTYHHGGPFDAALASRNRDKMYSPAAAVYESNMEAIRATPREYLEDSLRKNVPLQGTAVIPSGVEDFRGNVMSYEEGADLMREPDAAGGAYKRWEGMTYHPDDLKGKGANFELERDLKEKKRLAKGQTGEYELVSRSSRPLSLSHNSNDNVGLASASGVSEPAGLGRQNSTSKRLSEGFKRRFGSIRRKKVQLA